jgi:RNA polymerase sigma-70 factor (ECF subfamily)
MPTTFGLPCAQSPEDFGRREYLKFLLFCPFILDGKSRLASLTVYFLCPKLPLHQKKLFFSTIKSFFRVYRFGPLGPPFLKQKCNRSFPNVSNIIERPEQESDENLLARSRVGDDAAFCALVRLYESRLYNFIWRLVRHDEVAKDIFQETWLKAYAARGNFKGRSKFSTWLFSIALNLARNWWKRDKERLHLSLNGRQDYTGREGRPLKFEEYLSDPAPSALDKMLGRERQQKLTRALEHLPQTYREVLILVYQEDLSYEEIGKLMKKKSSNIKVLCFRALKKLKKMLG